MDPQMILRVLRRDAWAIIAASIIGALVAYVASSWLPPTYESRTTLLVGQSLDSGALDYTGILAAQLQAQTYASLAVGRAALQETIDALDLDVSVDELATRVRAQSAAESRFVEIVAADGAPEGAAAIANSLAAQVIARTEGGQSDETLALIRRELDATAAGIAEAQAALAELAAAPPAAERTDQILALDARIVTLRSIRATLLVEASQAGAEPISIVSTALPNDSPISPRPVVNAILAAIIGAGAALIGSLARTGLRGTASAH